MTGMMTQEATSGSAKSCNISYGESHKYVKTYLSKSCSLTVAFFVMPVDKQNECGDRKN